VKALPQEKFIREMITPEGVDLKLRLADAGERISAFFLDTLFIVLILVGVSLGLLALAFLFNWRTLEFAAIVWMLGFFLLRNFYFTFFELTLRAATPGKRIIGLRVAMRDGSPLTANAVFARNAMRELEFFLPISFLLSGRDGIDGWIVLAGLVWCGVFLFFPLFNRDRLRVGDLVAGTWVVVAPRRLLDAELSAGTAAQSLFSDAALDAYGIKELNILEDVLRRKEPATMAAVASRIRAKIKFETPMPDEEFLSAYYVGLRGRLENRLLFGTRRQDKHQKV
jgi:uncharacterized RDD family membrane protein YckC